MATFSASAHVLTSHELFMSVVAFIPGVPFRVLRFQRTDAAAYNAAHTKQLYQQQQQQQQNTSARDAWRVYETPIASPPLTLVQVAVALKHKRVLDALEALALTPRYATSPHVQLDGIVGYALTTHLLDTSNNDHLDVTFLDWLYLRFKSDNQRYICDTQLATLAAISSDISLAAVEWLDAHNYDFPASMMDAAAAAGNLAVVEFLHIHSRNGCTTRAMDDAARHGHLAVVTFLHTNRSEGCTEFAQGRALEHGHVDVLAFLHTHRSEGCSAMAMLLATMQGQFVTVRYALEHGFAGFEQHILAYAVTYGQLEIVKLLVAYNKAGSGCSLAALLDAERLGHTAIVDFLCCEHALQTDCDSVGSAISEAFACGQVRFAVKLAWCSAGQLLRTCVNRLRT